MRPWPVGDSEMAARIRAHPWAETPLGRVEDWPQSLRTVIDLALASPTAMMVFWGAELTQIHNDGFRILTGSGGAHELGRPGRGRRPEWWSGDAPVPEAVLRGESRTIAGRRLAVLRDGETGDAWFDLTFTPLRDEAGNVAGVLLTALETTEAVRCRAALRESEARFRHIAEHGPAVVWMSEANGGCVYLPESWRAFTGQPPEAGRGFGWLDVVHPEDRAATEEAVQAAHRRRAPLRLEHRLRRAEGGWGWVSSVAEPRFGADGAFLGHLGSVADITERRETKEALRENAHRLALAVSASRAGVFEHRTPLGPELHFSERCAEILGFARSDLPPYDAFLPWLWERVHPEDRERLSDAYADFISGRAPRYEIEMRLRHADGRWIWTRGYAEAAERDALGRVRRVVGLMFDIDARRRALEALKESEARHRAVLEQMPVGVAVAAAPSGELLFHNARGIEVLGHPLLETADYRGYAAYGALHEDGSALPPERYPIARALLAGETVDREPIRYRRGDDRITELEVSAAPINDASGARVLAVSTFQDVSARRALEAARDESERRLRTLILGLPELIWRADSRGDWSWSSPQWTAFTGLSAEESLGRGWLAALHPEDRDAARAAWSAAEAGEGFEMECRVLHAPEGRHRWLRSRATPVRDAEGRVLEWIGASTDVDDLRRMQERQAVMVAELQHRTRNLIAVVLSIARQTMKGATSFDAFGERFAQRLETLSRVQGLLSRANETPITIERLVRMELDALGGAELWERISLEGPEARLPPRAVQTLALGIHELATNARKHGALAASEGRLEVVWRLNQDEEEDPRLALDWIERGAPPGATSDARGYGRQLIERALPYALGATTRLDFTPEGARCAIDLPLKRA